MFAPNTSWLSERILDLPLTSGIMKRWEHFGTVVIISRYARCIIDMGVCWEIFFVCPLLYHLHSREGLLVCLNSNLSYGCCYTSVEGQIWFLVYGFWCLSAGGLGYVQWEGSADLVCHYHAQYVLPHSTWFYDIKSPRTSWVCLFTAFKATLCSLLLKWNRWNWMCGYTRNCGFQREWKATVVCMFFLPFLHVGGVSEPSRIPVQYLMYIMQTVL